MTDTYLRSLGFVPAAPQAVTLLPFDQSWLYQHDHLAQDGTPLFIEHPLGIDCCRLSSLPTPLGAQDVFAEMTLHDQPMLEVAMQAFYALHGGKGALVVPFVPFVFRPYRQV